MELLFAGRWVDVAEALRWGGVSEVVEPGALLQRARELARLLESGPPLVFAAIKEVVREVHLAARVCVGKPERPNPAFESAGLHDYVVEPDIVERRLQGAMVAREVEAPGRAQREPRIESAEVSGGDGVEVQ